MELGMDMCEELWSFKMQDGLEMKSVTMEFLEK
jgi:hypothetical protein